MLVCVGHFMHTFSKVPKEKDKLEPEVAHLQIKVERISLAYGLQIAKGPVIWVLAMMKNLIVFVS